ncbi:hypothetical protein O5551_18525 [Escherichia coli]|nr:hypothetical protein [Escherichia coli]MCZ5507132.1 hypothetical protein [Escherichia coli]
MTCAPLPTAASGTMPFGSGAGIAPVSCCVGPVVASACQTSAVMVTGIPQLPVMRWAICRRLISRRVLMMMGQPGRLWCAGLTLTGEGLIHCRVVSVTTGRDLRSSPACRRAFSSVAVASFSVLLIRSAVPQPDSSRATAVSGRSMCCLFFHAEILV